MKFTKFVILMVILIGFVIFPVTAKPVSLDYTNLDGDIVSLQDGTVTVIDWAASWCSICKQNQQNINAIYSEYSDRVQFMTISFGGSGDDLSDVSNMKGNYVWEFGLDHNNKADDFGVTNGYVWILSETLEVEKEWEYQIVSQSALSSALDSLLTDGEIIEDNPSSQEIDSYGLETNPLLVFFLILILVTFGVIIFKGDDEVPQKTDRRNLFENKMKEAEKNWDWNDK